MRRLAYLFCVLALLTPKSPAQAPPRRLTLREAIELGLKSNLSVQVAGAQVDEAAGTRERRFSVLLPHISGQTLANYQNRNLRALGIPVQGMPSVVGPFPNYDFRLYADQTIVDRQATHGYRASERLEQASKLSYQDARELVIRQAAGLYLDAQSAAAQGEAAESRVANSQALAKLAQDQHVHGLATGVDRLRAQVQLQRDRQNLLVARNNYQTTLLNLQRFLGIRPGTPLELAERLEFSPVEIPDLEQAILSAVENRPDYRALMSQREALLEQQKANRARYLPKLSVSGNYGFLGRSFGDLPGTGIIQGTLSVPLFDRDRNGEQKELQSRVQRLDAQLEDLKRGIELELHKAALDLRSSEEQVRVTEAGLDLAQREMTLTRDRFRNGVSDNIEVVTAQSSLQAAQDDHIAALARHSDATMALVRALGASEQNYLKYLGGR